MTTIYIIGGGIAGLYAGLLCAERFPHRPIEVHEASGRFGGRIHTYYGPDYRYETGAGRFNKNHQRLWSLIDRYHLTPQPIQAHKYYCGPKNPSELPAVLKSLPPPSPSKTFGEWLDKGRTPEERQELQKAFGYDAEFDWMNAVDALRLFKTDFKESLTYYSLKEGLSELVARMVQDLERRPNVRLVLRSYLRDLKTLPGGGIELYWNRDDAAATTTTTATTIGAVVFLALPKNALGGLKGLGHLKEALESVREVPLHRIYGQFYKEGYGEPFMKRRTTGGLLRQYIPMNLEKRMSMVSYCDTGAADYWNRVPKKELKSRLEGALGALARECEPGYTETPKLRWVRSYYWKAGVHVWRPGVSSGLLARRLLTPMGATVPCFIIGEAYSRLQGWIEGALWTVDEVMKNEKYLPRE
jgi:Flavin containing amine oxidoreductase